MPTPKPNSSKPASPKPDYAVQARNIALDVSHRRRAGEVITDEQILRDHPNLVGPLQEQLTRLNRLETARLRVDHESAQGPGKAGVQQPVPLASDKLGTLQLPFNETPINEVANDNEVAINEAPTNAAPIDAAPIDEVSDANAAPDESAPTKLGDATDQLRITLKEQGGEVRNQSTMVLIEPLLAEAATADATDSSASAPHAASVDSSVPCYRPSVRAPMG